MVALRGGMVQEKTKKKAVVKKSVIKKAPLKTVIKPAKKSPLRRSVSASKAPAGVTKPQTSAGSKQTAIAPVTVNLTPMLLPKRPLLTLSPFRFPADTAKLMVHTARYGGVAFVVLGAIMTLFSMQQLLRNVDSLFFVQVSQVSQTAELIDSTTDTISNPIPVTSIKLNQQSPLHGVVLVEVLTPNAYGVDIYAYSNNDQIYLGTAKQQSDDKWVFEWDTTKYDNGVTFQVYALVVSSPGTEPHKTTVLPTVQIQNQEPIDVTTGTDSGSSSGTTDTITTTTGTIDTLPPVKFSLPSTPKGIVNIPIEVQNAKYVSLMLYEEITSSESKIEAKRNTSDINKWLAVWDTTVFSDGKYQARVHVVYNDGKVFDTKPTPVTLLADPAVEEDIIEPEPDAIEESDDEILEDVASIQPLLKLRLSSGEVLSGTESIEAELQGVTAEAIALYARSSVSVEQQFLGNMMKVSPTKWVLNWYTVNTINGSYSLFARAKTSSPTPLESAPVAIKVLNQTTTEKPLETLKQEIQYEDSIKKVTAEIASEAEELVTSVVPNYIIQTPSTTPALRAPVAQTPLSALFEMYHVEIDAALLRLGTAYRSKDAAAEKRARAAIDSLSVTMAKSAGEGANYDETLNAVKSQLNERITQYLADIDKLNSLLIERNRTDVLQDSDRDGVSDFDEVVIYKTDPYAADSDSDGYTDGAEIISGFDPLNEEPESVVAYESPKDSGVYRDDLLSVDSIESVEADTTADTTSVDTISAVLKGKGLPNSFVTLYVFSTPVIVTVKTDVDGSWRYRFDKELEDGEHNVYVGITDNAGRIVAKSQPLKFIKEAQAIAPVEAATLETVVTEEDNSSLITGYIFYAIISISVVAIGLVLILLGLHLESRRRRLDFVAPATVV